MSLRLSSLVLDVNDMKRAVSFWRDALRCEIKEEGEQWATLADPKGVGADLGLQPTTDVKRDINRAHIDLVADDVQKEVRRLESIGATRADWPYYPEGARYVVMRDPDGNEFCVCPT